MTKAFRYLAHSEIGLVRKNNQDSGYVSPTMLMVADGMGGAAAGDLASAVAINELKASDGDFRGKDMLELVAGAISRANDQIADLVRADPSLDGMGTTVCGVLFDGDRCALANIGDSRGYLLREGVMRRITRDHSWVQTLVDDGRISEAEALVHPHRSLILRVLNGHPSNTPDLDWLDVEPGDRLLFCSDGLCGLVTDADIAQVLVDSDPERVLQRLIAMAHHEGGLDNITIVLADVVDGEGTTGTQVLGAAAELDLSVGGEDTAILRADDAEPGDTRPRPDPGAADRAERIRYSPTDRRRASGWAKLVLAILLPLLALGGGAYGWYSYIQTKLFVGANDDAVAIFRGIPDKPLGLPLSSVFEQQDTKIGDLPPFYRERVLNTIPVDGVDAARATVSELKVLAERCVQQRQTRATATAAPSPSASPSTSPSGSPSPVPSSSLSQTPQHSPGAEPGGTTSPSVSPSPSPSSSPTNGAPEDC